ncbi:hypothetical protein IFR04_009385 [Cadophora malorum]|uniref:Uncharacterized protein n=1 Tax=Cadophora malorum TaxID=108018 RepID=A0A8H7TD57_9HELO|nr:hypothetical protein IFR04_009385 [Cadophora malorum]
MRAQILSLLCLLYFASAAIIPGLDGIAGLGGILGGLVPPPAPAPVPASGSAPETAPLPASDLIPLDPATRPDLPDPNTPPPVINQILPEGSTISQPFKIYLIPSQLTPFKYIFENSFYGAYNYVAFLDAECALVPSASTAGTFVIVQPQCYLLSLSPQNHPTPPAHRRTSPPPSANY